jgi:hypothetical protein
MISVDKIKEGINRFLEGFSLERLNEVFTTVKSIIFSPKQFLSNNALAQIEPSQILLRFTAVISTISSMVSALIILFIGVPQSGTDILVSVPVLNLIMGAFYEIGMTVGITYLTVEFIIKWAQLLSLQIKSETVLPVLAFSLTPTILSRVIYAVPSIWMLAILGLSYTGILLWHGIIQQNLVEPTEQPIIKTIIFKIGTILGVLALIIFIFSITEGMRLP